MTENRLEIKTDPAGTSSTTYFACDYFPPVSFNCLSCN
jgi:hypothetical protein